MNILIKKSIPNFLTISNLLLGFVSIILLSLGLHLDQDVHIRVACYLILVATVFDSIDGKIARKLGVSSNFGKEIDSLADMISFCLVPSFMLFVYYYKIGGIDIPLLIVLSSFPLIFGAIRLAKYNALKEMRDSVKYIGLPTPANAIFICSAILYLHYRGISNLEPISFMNINNIDVVLFKWMNFPLKFISNQYALIIIAVFSSLLLMSKVDYEKFPLISFRINKRNSLDLIKVILFLLLLLSSVLLGYYDIVLLFFMIIYIYGNVIKYLVIKIKK